MTVSEATADEFLRRVNGDETVGQAFASKPDPDEPWRYVCPECEGQVRRSGKGLQYGCSTCSWTGYRADLWDRKRSIRVGTE